MSDQLIALADGFWNIRGSFRAAKLFDIGTQMSLVRLSSGKHVLLDSYFPSADVQRKLAELTDNGRTVAAIVNLHPFHTLHVRAVAEAFPHARLYGTSRHVSREPGLRWESERVEHSQFADLFGDELVFTMPPGVELIPANENLHFASVLAIHPASRTLHVTDTLMWNELPLIGGLTFHPTLASVLQKRPGAADEFEAWAQELVERCQEIDHICTAHLRRLPPQGSGAKPVSHRVQSALERVKKTLAKHRKRYG